MTIPNKERFKTEVKTFRLKHPVDHKHTSFDSFVTLPKSRFETPQSHFEVITKSFGVTRTRSGSFQGRIRVSSKPQLKTVRFVPFYPIPQDLRPKLLGPSTTGRIIDTTARYISKSDR